MKNLNFIFALLCLASIVYGQQEINCDTVHIPPTESEYVLPYPIGKTYKVTQSNCFPNGGHRLTFAYDFDTKMGDTIIACRRGVVTFVNDQYEDTDWVSGHENNVFIGHADGTRIRYTHLMKGGALVRVGQAVSRGQPIGLSGNSGNTGGFPHLHLSAFRDNTSFNRQNTIPINFCNTTDPVNSQNLLISGVSYTARAKGPNSVSDKLDSDIQLYPQSNLWSGKYKKQGSWTALVRHKCHGIKRTHHSTRTTIFNH